MAYIIPNQFGENAVTLIRRIWAASKFREREALLAEVFQRGTRTLERPTGLPSAAIGSAIVKSFIVLLPATACIIPSTNGSSLPKLNAKVQK